MTAPLVPVTGKTPIYGIEYLLEGEPAFWVRARLQRNSEKLEGLLQQRAIAPPAAQDLATLSGRVSTLENRIPVNWTTVATTISSDYSFAAAPAAIVPGLSFTINVPIGRTLEIKAEFPTVRVYANTTAQLLLMVAPSATPNSTTTLDANEWSTGAGAAFQPGRMEGSLAGDGQGWTVTARALLSGGQATLPAAIAGVKPRLRYRIT